MTINYISSKHKGPINLNEKDLKLLKLVGDLGFVNLNQLDMLWSVISHYPTRFTRSILREWCSHDGLLKKVDKSKDKRPSKLSRTVYHLTNKAKHFLANQHIWPNSAVNAPNVGLNSHNEQAIEVIVQGIYAAAFKYQTLGTTNQLYTTNNYQKYIVTNPNFIDKKIIVNQSLKAPDGAGAQQAAGGKRKGRTVADPQQRTPVEQASRTVPTSLTSTATNKQTINDQISIDKTVQDQLPQWLATYLPSNETLVDTLPQLSNQIGRLLVDGVLVPSVIRSTNNHKHGKEQDSLSSNSKVSDTSNNGNSDSGNNRNITSNDIDNANKSNLNALLKQYSIVGTPTNANQPTKSNTFEKKHARQGLAHVKDVSRKRHRRSLSGEATGKPLNTVVSGRTARNCNGDDLSIFKAGDALCSQISLYEAYNQLNTSLSSYCHLQGMLNTGATVALWLLTTPVSDARDEINASQDSQDMVAIKPHRSHRKPNRKGRKHHQAVLRKVDKKGNQPHSGHSQQAVQSFFAEAQREQEINDRLEVYTDRQWRKSYEARSDNQATQSSQDDSNTKGFFSIEGTDEHIPEENGFTNLINKAKSDDYINYLANQAEQTTEPSEIMDHEREQSSNKLNKKQQNVLENHRGGKMPPKCPQNAPKMGALNQDHSANSEGAPKMPPKCPQNGGKMGAHPENRERSGGGAQKFAASGGAVSRTSLILLLP